MDSRTKLSSSKAHALENLIKTFDRIGLMLPYLITVEMKPGSSLDRGSNIIYDKPQKVYGLVIRIMDIDKTTLRISIDEEDEI